MKNRIIVLLTMMAVMPFAVYAQSNTEKNGKAKHKTHKSTKTTTALPPWAKSHHYDAKSHIYFPDYYTYYDPHRGGYVYWNNGQYVFTPSLPPVMEKMDLDKSRVQILKGLSLDLHPEQNYPRYMKLYPPDNNGNTLVPVPIPGNPSK